MRWDDLDLDSATWRIPAARSKSGRTLTLPLVPDAIAILRRRQPTRANEPWVFVGRGRAGHLTYIYEAWEDLLKRAGLSKLTRHDLRRSLGTMLAAQGASPHVIAAALGHASVASARAYVHLAAEQSREALVAATTALTRRS
jgi:integrase